MGTAGPLALARDILYNESNTPFFVLNRWASCPPSGAHPPVQRTVAGLHFWLAPLSA